MDAITQVEIELHLRSVRFISTFNPTNTRSIFMTGAFQITPRGKIDELPFMHP